MGSSETKSPFIVSIRTASGNIPEAVKDAVATAYVEAGKNHAFAVEIATRVEATELSIYDREDEPGKKEVRAVFELDVHQGVN